MKIIEKNKQIYTSFASSYDLDQCCLQKEGFEGAGILYAIMETDLLPVSRVFLDYESDIHSGYSKRVYIRRGFLERFQTCSDLLSEFCEGSFESWRVELPDDSRLLGDTGSIVNILSENETINFTRYMMEIEEATFRYHPFSKEFVDSLMSRESMSLRRAVEVLQRLSVHPDIFMECNSYYCSGMEEVESCVDVEGYTAEKLMQEVGLHPVGACLMLADLRENPREAKTLIKRGIVRK